MRLNINNRADPPLRWLISGFRLFFTSAFAGSRAMPACTWKMIHQHLSPTGARCSRYRRWFVERGGCSFAGKPFFVLISVHVCDKTPPVASLEQLIVHFLYLLGFCCACWMEDVALACTWREAPPPACSVSITTPFVGLSVFPSSGCGRNDCRQQTGVSRRRVTLTRK